ncbi:MAG: alpha/beta hydrolase [Kiritimatiellaeota bacterium]|nr:alpha/beta hydrolase [Kiritimatiellota bacterium]
MKNLWMLAMTALSVQAWAAGVKVEKDVAYLPAGRAEKADLYLPDNLAAGAKAQALLWIHGGGFSGGDKAQGRELNIGTNFAARGYVMMSINYALQQKGGAQAWPQNIHDCKTAVRWLRANAARLHLDPDRIAVGGGSAGGHLASMVALTKPEDGLDPKGPYGEFSCAVQAGMDFYGCVDLTTWHNSPMLGKTKEEDQEAYRKASAQTYARKDSPPMLILHGTADKTVDIKQSETLAEALKKAGAVVEFVTIPGAPHTFHLQPKQKDLRPIVFEFLDKHLLGKTAAATK